ncbi:MAG: DUF3352 domain-containing protein [Chloroflexota bacterium]|nr:DUF3352 domain-containing protein [Chloroflexota bacterium]
MTDQDPTQRYEPPAAAEAPAIPPAPPWPAIDPVPTTPVSTAPTARPGRSRVRWLVAALVTLLVVGSAAGATLLLTADAGDPAVLAWAPADSIVYAEVRLDLPGDQRAELARVMAAFPGFDDQAAFPVKLNEALDVLLGKASDGEMSYQADIEPWFGGQVGVSIGAIPASGEASDARGLVLVSVKDATKAGTWAAKVLADVGAATATETYNGVTITTITPPAGNEAAAGVKAAWATFGPVMALGDSASVKAAIDTKGSAGLPTVAQFRTAQAALSGDHLGFAYVDAAAILESSEALTGAASEAMPSMPAFMDQLQVAWGAAAVRAEGGAFVVDTATPHMTALGAAKSSESRLPALLPPTTVALVEGHDVGETLQKAKELFAGDPAMAEGMKEVEDALALVGGYGAIVDWMGEVGLAITVDGDSIGGGLVVTPLDAAAPERLFTQLRGFIALAGGSSGLTVTEESHAGATIVVIDLGDLGDLAGMASDGAIEAPANLKIAYAVTDDVVVLGYGTDFVKAVLDARTGDSLAKSERFASALKLVDKAHGSLVWLDLAAMRGLVESQIPADEKGAYQTEIKPYLDAFDSVIGVNLPGETVDRSTLILRVSGD